MKGLIERGLTGDRPDERTPMTHEEQAKNILTRLYFYAPEYWTGATDEAGVREQTQHWLADLAVLMEALAQAAQEATAFVRGAMAAQDERERQAGEKCGVNAALWDCDWPEAVAEEVLVLRGQLQAAQPVWSKDQPTVPGWYWWKRGARTSIVHVVWEPTDSEGRGYFEVRGETILWTLNSLSGEWAGPIQLPNEV